MDERKNECNDQLINNLPVCIPASRAIVLPGNPIFVMVRVVFVRFSPDNSWYRLQEFYSSESCFNPEGLGNIRPVAKQNEVLLDFYKIFVDNRKGG